MFEKHMCLFLLLAFFTGIIYLSFNNRLTIQTRPEGHGIEHSISKLDSTENATFDDIGRRFILDVDNDKDVLVYLHIQKTGGTTFGRHLVRDLNVSRPCICYRRRRRCDCKNARNHHWIFSRYSTGWSCGLHADWTELNDCVDDMLNRMEKENRNRRYFYVTVLRDPIQRFLSEWKHVQRGSSWASAKLKCNGRRATLQEVPFCFEGENWAGVTLNEFVSCPHNLAHNRQTRMLANLSLVGCYNQTVLSQKRRSEILLESAKRNLQNMAYFGLTEFQSEMRFLFEQTFRVNFAKDFVQHHNTHASRVDISLDMRNSITQLNFLDIELYAFAKKLFFARVKHFSSALNDSVTS